MLPGAVVASEGLTVAAGATSKTAACLVCTLVQAVREACALYSEHPRHAHGFPQRWGATAGSTEGAAVCCGLGSGDFTPLLLLLFIRVTNLVPLVKKNEGSLRKVILTL